MKSSTSKYYNDDGDEDGDYYNDNDDDYNDYDD